MTEKEFDWNTFDAICQFHPSLATASMVMGVSDDTIQRRIKEKTGQTFKEYRADKEGTVRLSLQQKALNMALAGNVPMLIFSLKNLCDWSDKNEKTSININNSGGDQKVQVIQLAYAIPEKAKEIEENAND